jgi:hypothetical protein
MKLHYQQPVKSNNFSHICEWSILMLLSHMHLGLLSVQTKVYIHSHFAHSSCMFQLLADLP